MCGIDGEVDFGDEPEVLEFEEENNEKAIEVANRFLTQYRDKGTSIIPWAPSLLNSEGELVAVSDASYPPKAHYLSWTFAPDESFVETQPVSA
ncbi:MAG: hypothetical protein Q8R34_00070 [bacterium]|nr:hypothetical protein [bacterium]